MSRDGWMTKYDLYGLRPVAEVRAGVNSRNVAVSSDGRFVAVASYLPHPRKLASARAQALREEILKELGLYSGLH